MGLVSRSASASYQEIGDEKKLCDSRVVRER